MVHFLFKEALLALKKELGFLEFEFILNSKRRTHSIKMNGSFSIQRGALCLKKELEFYELIQEKSSKMLKIQQK